MGAGAAWSEQVQRGGSRVSEVGADATRCKQEVQRGKEQVQRGESRRRLFEAGCSEERGGAAMFGQKQQILKFRLNCKISQTNIFPIGLPYTFFLLKKNKNLFVGENCIF